MWELVEVLWKFCGRLKLESGGMEAFVEGREIHLTVYAENGASRRVMEKCGMTYDRFSPKELTYLDKERDLIYYVKAKS